MENTIENKKIFFSQYYGQHIQHDVDLIGAFPLTQSNIEFETEKCKIHLKPIKKLSKEDGQFILKTKFRINNVFVEDIESVGEEILTIYFKYEDKETGDEESFSISSATLIIDREWGDWLRLKGYAIPYSVLSIEDLIKYDWITLE